MFQVLIVEDEDRSLNNALKVLERIAPTAEITITRSRDGAIRVIHESEFDLIVCDLRIPSTEHNLDADERHGLAVHAVAREECPGTPLIFLTAYATATNVKNQLSSGGVDTYYVNDARPLVQLALKDGSSEFRDYLAEMIQGLEALETCPVTSDAGDLDPLLVRAVRMYGRSVTATTATVNSFQGLSGAIVAKARFEVPGGQSRSILVKVMDRSDASKEMDNYSTNVPNKLEPGYFAPRVDPPFRSGLRKRVALFYNIAGRHQDLFALLTADPAGAAEVVRQLATEHRAWTAETRVITRSVAELRRARLPDARCTEHLIAGGPLANAELLDIDLVECTGHGDLHGGNVLVDDSGRPTLIDFGDVGLSSAALDPLTLELSLIFHERSAFKSTDWPTLEEAENWADLDAYVARCPVAEFVRACRAWAEEISSPETLFATAYAHSMRQLKYGDVPVERALAVATSAAARLLTLR